MSSLACTLLSSAAALSTGCTLSPRPRLSPQNAHSLCLLNSSACPCSESPALETGRSSIPFIVLDCIHTAPGEGGAVNGGASEGSKE